MSLGEAHLTFPEAKPFSRGPASDPDGLPDEHYRRPPGIPFAVDEKHLLESRVDADAGEALQEFQRGTRGKIVVTI